MMLRQSLLIGVAGMAFAGASWAQQRGQSRDDLLDALTRHIQICGEMTDTQSRLTCYDRLQTQVGGVTPQAQPTPTPLQAQPAPTPLAPPPPPTTIGSGGSSISAAPLSPQPLGVPGGGTATLGAGGGTNPPPSTQDPNAAFDPRTAGYRPPETMGARPQPQLRRSGPRPVPNFSTPQPLVTLGATNLTYGDSRYWQVTVTITSNTPQSHQHPGRMHLHERRPSGLDGLSRAAHDPARRADHHRADRPADHVLHRFDQLQDRQPIERLV